MDFLGGMGIVYLGQYATVLVEVVKLSLLKGSSVNLRHSLLCHPQQLPGPHAIINVAAVPEP